MGIEPFLVASSVEAVMAQRLVRTICPHCKAEQKVERDYLRKIGFPAADIETAKFWHGAGCEECRQLGYQGRKGIYELLIVNEAIRPLILNRSSATTIAQRAIEAGMRTLRTDGWNKVKGGETTIEEVLRVTQIEEHLESLAGGEPITAPQIRSSRAIEIVRNHNSWPAGIPATSCRPRPTRTASGSSTPKSGAVEPRIQQSPPASRCRPGRSPNRGRRSGSRG